MRWWSAVLLVLLFAGCRRFREPRASADLALRALAERAEHASPEKRDCTAGRYVEALASCLHRGGGPDLCLAQVPGKLCDSDLDGLPDDLEEALGREYAPVFAFNGGRAGGNAETDWPASVRHFIDSAALYFRPDHGPPIPVDVAPSPGALPFEAVLLGGRRVAAADPAEGEGGRFWLCLKDPTGATGVRVESPDAMRRLKEGVDLVVIAHPANGSLSASSDLMIGYELFFAYNQFATVDNHEGDWEGIQLFVNRRTGAIDAAYFGRHPTTDPIAFVSRARFGERDVRGHEPSRGTNVSGVDGAFHGLRFWDFAGARHHLVAFVATGSHAMYDYPGNTYVARDLVRDTHNGDGLALVTFDGRLVSGFGSGGVPVKLNLRNIGEPSHPLLPWAAYRGQWGCTDDVIAKSWPGPFGNAIHPRTEWLRAWGSPPAP